jgi:hypothetical protein
LEDLREEERRLKSLETRVMLEQSGTSRSSWEGVDLLILIESISRNSQA